MIFLVYYWELWREGRDEEQAWGPCFQPGNKLSVVLRTVTGDKVRGPPGSQHRASGEVVFFPLVFKRNESRY